MADPTRTSQDISGTSDIDISIPAGCTWFRFAGDPIVMGATSQNCFLQLVSSGTVSTLSGHGLFEDGTVFQSTSASAVADTGDSSSSTTKCLHGEVVSPRAAGKKTIIRGFGGGAGQAILLWRRADAAADNDTLRVNKGGDNVVSGVLEIEWFYH